MSFGYTDVHGSETKRTVDPLSIVYMDRSSVLIAWCHLRRDFRVFRLDRMRDLCPTGQFFRPRRIPLLREALAHLRAQPFKTAEDCKTSD